MSDYWLPKWISEKNPIYIDNSILSTVATCSTKALLQYKHHLQSPEPSLALLAGSAAHEALAIYFQTGSEDSALAKFQTLYQEPGSAIAPEESLSWENTSATLTHWLTLHPLETLPFVVLPSSIERTIIHPLWESAWGKRVMFVGLIDAVIQWKDTGLLSILDHKTTGLPLTHHWTEKFQLSSQLSGYLWLAQETKMHESLAELTRTPNYDLQPVMSALINSIQFSKLPDSNRKCKLHGLPYLECRAFHAKSQFDGPFTRTPHALLQWHENAIALTEKWIFLNDNYPTLEFTALNVIGSSAREALFQYNGCQYCAFTPYCRGLYQPEQLPAMYGYRKWEPWLQGKMGDTIDG